MKPSACAPLIWISLFGLLAGCASDTAQLLPPGEHDIQAIWNGAAGQGSPLQQARQALRRPLEAEPQALEAPYSRSAANEIRSQFPRLPNPDLLLYVYPHLTGSEQAPVPGYTTVLPFYQKVQYALPGERLEDY